MTDVDPIPAIRGPRRGDTLAVVAGGLLGAGLLTAVHMPAGGIIGAVCGSALVSSTKQTPAALPALRILGLVLLGAAAGVRLDGRTLKLLWQLAVPLGLAILGLLVVSVVLAVILHRAFHIDAVTALLACAPGGVSEIAGMADQLKARSGIVVAIHVVRVIAVVIVALPILVHVVQR